MGSLEHYQASGQTRSAVGTTGDDSIPGQPTGDDDRLSQENYQVAHAAKLKKVHLGKESNTVLIKFNSICKDNCQNYFRHIFIFGKRF